VALGWVDTRLGRYSVGLAPGDSASPSPCELGEAFFVLEAGSSGQLAPGGASVPYAAELCTDRNERCMFTMCLRCIAGGSAVGFGTGRKLPFTQMARVLRRRVRESSRRQARHVGGSPPLFMAYLPRTPWAAVQRPSAFRVPVASGAECRCKPRPGEMSEGL
jgi:hypothetical protein